MAAPSTNTLLQSANQYINGNCDVGLGIELGILVGIAENGINPPVPPPTTTDFLAASLDTFNMQVNDQDNFRFPNLITLLTYFQMMSCAKQDVLDLHLVTAYASGSSVDIDSNPILASANFPGATYTVGIGVGWTITNNPLLTSVDLSGITTIEGQLSDYTITNNASLPSISLHSGVVFADDNSSYNWSDNAFTAAFVNLVLARMVASSVTALYMDLSGGTSAAPTGQGIIDKAALIVAGNSITTN